MKDDRSAAAIFFSKQKIHYIIKKDHRKNYLCNGACGTTKSKSTKNVNKVTCLNCLREIEKGTHKLLK